jgi:phosphatidate cytidylyltransferase
MKNLLIRAASGAGVLAIMIGFTYLGGFYLAACLGVISVIAIVELFRAFEKTGFRVSYGFGIASSVSVMAFVYAGRTGFLLAWISVVVMLALVQTTFATAFRLEDLAIQIFGVLYVSFFLSYLLRLDGSIYIWLVFFCSWGTDTFAYIFGMTLGRRKLCERISPKKSVEGAIGGVVGALALSSVYFRYLRVSNMAILLVVAAVGSVVSQVGDLCASALKRRAGIKDYGHLIAGHGGILDRFDSFLFACPTVFYLLEAFGF